MNLRECGVVFGVSFIVVSGLVMLFFYNVLLSALNKIRSNGMKVNTMEKICKDVVKSPILFWILKVMLFINILLILVAYLVLMNGFAQDLINGIFGVKLPDNYRFLTTLVIIGVLFLFSPIEKIKKLQFLSFVSLSVDVIFFVIIFVLFVSLKTSSWSKGTVKWLPDFYDFRTYLKLVKNSGSIVFSFACLVITPVHFDVKKKKDTYLVGLATFNSIILLILFYLMIAVTGYFSFFDNTENNIVNSYEGGSFISLLLRFLIFLELFLTYPLTNFQLSLTTLEVVEFFTSNFPGLIKRLKKVLNMEVKEKQPEDDISGELENLEGNLDQKSDNKKGVREKKLCGFISVKYFKLVAVSFFLCSLEYLLAVLIPEATKLLNYVGSVILVSVLFVFPSYFYLHVHKDKPLIWKLVFFCIVAVLTTLFGVIPTVVNLLEEFKVIEL